MSLTPRFWDTKKGLLLKAIVMSKWRTRKEIIEITKLTQHELNVIISELLELDLITEDIDDYSHDRSKYFIEDYDLYCEYRDYLQGKFDSKYLSKEYREEREQLREFSEKTEAIYNFIKDNGYENTIISKVIELSLRENVGYRLFSEHLFLEGDLLDRFSKDVIAYSRTKVLVVNPFVDQCSLSDKLKEACLQGKEVTLLTRSPDNERTEWVRASRSKYHNALHQSGVNIFYNNRIHSKVIVADDCLSIVSSLNFKIESSGGANLEAGIVTWEKNTLKSMMSYCDSLLKDFETKENPHV